jgi:transposase-like protein
MNLIDVTKKFATPEACNDFIESMRWPEGVECLKCNSKRVSKYQKQEGSRKRVNPKTGEAELKPVPARTLYVCLDCNHQFSATTGTIFGDTHLDLEKWFIAAALMVNAKKGVSAKQLQRDLGIAYKTAWYLSHRIRQAMALIEMADQTPLAGGVEIDETYMGGKYDERRKRARWDKEPVFGMVERDGRARTYHMPGITMKGVVEKIKDNVSIDADAVYTDDGKFYGTTAGCLKNHNHQKVNHIADEWVRGDVHTGTIDGYWGLLKRGVIGSFHQISIKHLQRYLNEFQFRWNNRESKDIFALVIAALVIGAALPYADLTGALEAESGNGRQAKSNDVPF